MNRRELEIELENLTDLLKLVQEVALSASRARSTKAAFSEAIQIICDHKGWTAGHVFLLDHGEPNRLVSSGAWHCLEEHGYEPLRRATLGSTIARGKDLVWDVLEYRQALWIEDLAARSDWARGQSVEDLSAGAMFPIRIGERIVGVMEFYSTSPIERDEAFLEMMNNFGIQLGHVVERTRLERRLAETSEAEQRQIGQELHDTLGQQITAVTMLARGLQGRLADEGIAESERASRIVEHLERAKSQINDLVCGLIPAEIGADELASCLSGLAARSSRLYDTDCRFEGSEGVAAETDTAAMQLYRIAQEAVHNAVTHGEADNVAIGLEPDSDHHGWATLSVRDDGSGFDLDAEYDGMGLRIMRHRTSLIDGELEVESSPQGTLIRCRFPASSSG